MSSHEKGSYARLWQRETKNVTACGNRHILLASDCVAHRRRAHILPGIEVPQRLATVCVNGLERAGVVAKKNQVAGGCHGSAGRSASTDLGVFPRNRTTIEIKRDQKFLRIFARDAFHSG